MNNDDFWERRLRAYKTKLIQDIIDYCDIYDIINNTDEIFNADSVRSELTEIIDSAIRSFLSDNDN